MEVSTSRTTLANVLPPIFICTIVGTIWSIYLGLHLLPMLQLGSSQPTVYSKALFQTIVSQFLTGMFAICFARSLLGSPGSVPDDFATDSLTMREVKATGEKRYCKWCHNYKPDRCHHCRTCQSCILKMDHHCPWIMNCVGFRNHKYFFLLVVYAVANCLFICFTLVESVQRSVVEETPSTDRFLLVLGLVLSIIMGFLMSCFLSFHTWLMLKGMTTIEFCEKNLSVAADKSKTPLSYDRGFITNIEAVLGPHWYLWFLPTSPPEGNGLQFTSAAGKFDKKFDKKLHSEPERTGQREATP
mmetsp:Transcript_64017/g.101545  ORF Transcript_64017/g.101545 Transcript_64017/m.101545 type:complete len:300 (+) Transcript_64017:91-990(+)